jgi:DNA repair exonuclease SbcCD ATPase subunit
LKGLVLLNGEPANKSGKSTFAYDLLHFLLFGKTNTNKARTLGELFNNYLPETRTINVEGCINIDGEDYIIKRNLTRPAPGKKTKTISNKVEYYHLDENGNEELLPENNESGESARKTSKIIKDALGNESDFDLIISANAKDLDSLITLTETEKGRLLSRWIGLSVIEDKDIKAREKWNREISVGRYSDMYNSVKLEEEIKELETNNVEFSEEIKNLKTKICETEKKIQNNLNHKETLLASKPIIDNNLLKIDVTTLENQITSLIENGKRQRALSTQISNEINEIGIVEFSEEDYLKLKKENEDLIAKMSEARANINNLKRINESLQKSEYCPTCGKKFDNIDNSKQINENTINILELTQNGINWKKRSDEINVLMTDIETKRSLFNKKNQLELKLSAINTQITSLLAEHKEKTQLLAEINKNFEAIKLNSRIDADINVINTTINTENNLKISMEREIINFTSTITKNEELIALRKSYLLKITEERKIERYWKLYLQMIGKDGIGKMVLRNTLPIINNEINKLLGDVADFKVEIVMNDKNDIDFLLVRDDVITRLSAASGLERTQASLALRVVLGNLSKLSKPPFILLDEVLGTVSKDNYDNMRVLYEKISEYFEFILHITHISDITDWHKSIVTVKKENNISVIK